MSIGDPMHAESAQFGHLENELANAQKRIAELGIGINSHKENAAHWERLARESTGMREHNATLMARIAELEEALRDACEMMERAYKNHSLAVWPSYHRQVLHGKEKTKADGTPRRHADRESTEPEKETS